jgi:hypothetical protein
MKELGFVGHKKPKDYTEKKYIVLPIMVEFSGYLEMVGSISPIILESQISLNFYDIEFLPFKVNIFERDKFWSYVIKDFASEKVARNLKQYDQMCYADKIGDCKWVNGE